MTRSYATCNRCLLELVVHLESVASFQKHVLVMNTSAEDPIAPEYANALALYAPEHILPDLVDDISTELTPEEAEQARIDGLRQARHYKYFAAQRAARQQAEQAGQVVRASTPTQVRNPVANRPSVVRQREPSPEREADVSAAATEASDDSLPDPRGGGGIQNAGPAQVIRV